MKELLIGSWENTETGEKLTFNTNETVIIDNGLITNAEWSSGDYHLCIVNDNTAKVMVFGAYESQLDIDWNQNEYMESTETYKRINTTYY